MEHSIFKRAETLCAYCKLRLGLSRWITDDGKSVHKSCRALYHASRVIGHQNTHKIRVRYTILANGQPQVQCDSCDRKKKMMCNAEDIEKYLIGDNWELFGDTLLCGHCTSSVRKAFYAT